MGTKTRPATYKRFACPKAECSGRYTSPLPIYGVTCRGVDRKRHPEVEMKPVKEEDVTER